jgi:hypothetical protein
MSTNATDGRLNALLDEVSADRLMEYNRTIAQWERLSGTPDERKAFEYVEETLKGFGLTTTRHDPICLVSLPGPAALTLLDPDEHVTCITHSFSASTGPDGVTAEVVYVGNGTAADYQAIDVQGKIALTDGLATPAKVGPSERAGVVGVINANAFEVHDMIVSPVWGSPTHANIDQLPTIPHVSIDGPAGQLLKERLERGPQRVRITTQVDTGWRPLPVLVATLQPDPPTDQYVLLSGHIDSWYYGAMDNGSANAAMIEATRVLARQPDQLRRGLQVAFWSGHSHGRYATSAWYVDAFWQDLHDHCVAHVNIDSPGGKGADHLGRIGGMAETYAASKTLIGQLCGADLPHQRAGRAGDQSFWGAGIPSATGKVYTQPPSSRHDQTVVFGWWWHTPDDTLDKLDPDTLARDTRVLLAAVDQLTHARILPFDQTASVEEIRQALVDIHNASGEALDLSPAIHAADQLRDAAVRLTARCQATATDAEVGALNACLMRVSRCLIPVSYTEAGPFGQDPALNVPAVPGLRAATQLAQLPPDSPDAYLLLTQLQRERNRLIAALTEAEWTIDDTLDRVKR